MYRLIALFAVITALAACETTKGAGEDIQNLGETMEDAVNEPA